FAEEKVKSEERENVYLRFLNGNIIDTEESFADLANQEEFDTVPDISPEQASYNSLEALSLDDSFSSLDELARRIEIAEIAPAEGLVSILKKRDDRDGKTVAQVQQRQTKRRVRFQELEDTFDQGILILLTHSICSQALIYSCLCKGVASNYHAISLCFMKTLFFF
uniref:Consortin C-terminal domain-containing protein n=1 Tax=Pavo cristatus TaxID=9049 RepID=A0A8C9G9Q4_PAVCR